MSRKNDIKRLIAKHKRHLQKLKEQQASFGLHTPAHILTEIEDTEAEIEKLQTELKLLDRYLESESTFSKSSDSFAIAVSDFAGNPQLGSAIADEIEEALLTKIKEARLNVEILEGVIETQIDGPTEAEEIAREKSLDLIVWGKLIDYGNNNVKLFPKIFIFKPREDLRMRGRNLAASIINPSDITLREQTAINFAEFAALVFGVLNFNRGEYGTAIKVFSSIANNYEAEANFYLGISHYLSNPYSSSEAIDYLEKAIKLYPDFGIAYVNLGMIHMDSWSYNDAAYDSFIEAKMIAERTGDIELLSGANSGLGLYYFRIEDYEKAKAYFQASLDGYVELKYNDNTAHQYGNLALVKLRKGELNEAIRLFEEALDIHREVKDWLGEANDLSNLGTVYREKKNYSEALNYQNLALKIYENKGYVEGKIKMLGNIGINYANQQDYATAETYFQEELKLVKAIEDSSGKVDVLKRLGQIHLLQQKPNDAKIQFEEALYTYECIGSVAGVGEMYYWLGTTYKELGETETAIQHYNRALNMFQGIADQEMENIILEALEGLSSQ